MARFDNKVVLVSGGARGQGAAEARLLVAQGAKVVIGDVLDNQGQALAIELGPAASFVRLITVTVGTRVEIAVPLTDDRTRDCHHLGIEVALGAAELWRPNF